VKFSDQPPADTWHAYSSLEGKRLLGSAGCFRGVEVPDELNDDLSMICRMLAVLSISAWKRGCAFLLQATR
jgi:hypothetical protein